VFIKCVAGGGGIAATLLARKTKAGVSAVTHRP
jgi:hypothetical protein